MSNKHPPSSRWLCVVYLQSLALFCLALHLCFHDYVMSRETKVDVERMLDLQTAAGMGANNKKKTNLVPPRIVPSVDCKNTWNNIPSFIVAGAQKSGTTALFNILSKHSDIQTSRKFETHFFDFTAKKVHKDRGHASEADEKSICTLRSKYQDEFRLNEIVPTSITFEKSPAYLCKPHVPGYIARVAPWTKILLILRNPIDRAYSQWKMIFNSLKSTDPFPKIVQREIVLLQKLKLTDAPSFEAFVKNQTDSFGSIPQTLRQRSRLRL